MVETVANSDRHFSHCQSEKWCVKCCPIYYVNHGERKGGL